MDRWVEIVVLDELINYLVFINRNCRWLRRRIYDSGLDLVLLLWIDPDQCLPQIRPIQAL